MSQYLNSFKPVIVIPVYNGRDSLLRLIPQIMQEVDIPLIIVDDGSTDGIQADDFPGHLFLQHSENRGKGAAIKTGLRKACEAGHSHAVTLDADGQHDPGSIDHFLKRSSERPFDLVIGARDLMAAHMPFHRKLSNNITSLMISLRTGSRVYDSQVGYRCYPLYDSRLWESDQDGFQLESDVFLRVPKLRLRLQWVTIPVIYGEQDSHMHLVLDTLRFVRMYILSFCRV